MMEAPNIPSTSYIPEGTTYMADTFAKYHCNYCEEDVNGIRIRCLECEDFDLCLECFACGAQIGKHKASHAYQFMDTGNVSVFPGNSQWTAREEVRLLDAIEQYGYGNWADIARHIETRTADEAQHKYVGTYIEGSVGKMTWKPALENTLHVPIDNTPSDTGPLSPNAPSSLPAQLIPQEDMIMLGYMFHRDDFEREWDNEAESSIASLFVHPVDDEDIDIALKLAQCDMYIRRLRERTRRKRVIRDYQLVQQFFQKEREKLQVPPKKKPKEDREILMEKMRTISQFQTALEHQNLINSMTKEKQIRTRIKELLRYRRNGIKHIEECNEFEIARSRRDKKKDLKKKPIQPNQMFTFHAGDVHSDSNDSSGFARKVVKKRRRKKSDLFSRKKVHASRYWKWKMANRELQRHGLLYGQHATEQQQLAAVGAS